jgi:DegV family protein with EDD domain
MIRIKKSEAEMKIGIITDSTADLPQVLVREYGIEIIPLQVSIDEQQYTDGVDLSPDEFFAKIQNGEHRVSTSQPAPGIFMECYRRMLERFDIILAIHMTGKLSGTLRAAQLASDMFPGGKIRVIDSESTSMGLGGLVLEAARAVQRGMNPEQIIAMIQRLRERVHFLVVLDTLEFIRRGGRVSRLQSFLSSILKIKVLLKLIHGDVEAVAKVRTRQESIAMLLEKFREQLAVETKAIIAVMHTAAEEEAHKLKSIIQDTYRNAEIIISQAGPVLGIHVGPGALALIMTPKE